MFRVGIVAAQDLQNLRVRVRFPDRDANISWWLPIVVSKTQDDKVYWIPDIGEQVVCLMDAHDEDGAVLGAIYSSVDTTPVQSPDKWHVGFKDGASLEYDRNLHLLTYIAQDGAVIKYDAARHFFDGNLPGAATITLEVGSGGSINLITGLGAEITLSNLISLTSPADIDFSTSLGATSLNTIITAINSIINLLETAVQSGTGIGGTPPDIT